MTSRCPCAFKLSTVGWICQPCSLCLSNRQTMTKVAIFCHHARPQRGQEEKCGMNHVPARVTYSSLATRCTTSAPAAWAQIIPQEKGDREQGGKSLESRNGKGFQCFCREGNSLVLGARHVCTRMGFKNSNRTLSVFKDSYEKFVCPNPKSRSLPVINALR